MFGRFTSQERTNVHRTAFFLHTPERTLLGAAKSQEETFPRVSRHGRHFANVGDGIIYLDLVVARTVVSNDGKKFSTKDKMEKNIPQHQSKYAILKFIID